MLLVVSFARPSFAQNNPTQCSPIYSGNYALCCKSAAGAIANKNQCSAYDAGIRTTTTAPAAPTRGTVGSSVATPPINSATQSATSGVDFGSSISPGSPTAINQCSAIKLNSLIKIMVWIKCVIVVAIIPLVFALAFLFFLWGVFKFIRSSESKDKEEGKKTIIAGLIGLFVMTSVWGIVKIAQNTLGVSSGVPFLQTQYLDTKAK